MDITDRYPSGQCDHLTDEDDADEFSGIRLCQDCLAGEQTATEEAAV